MTTTVDVDSISQLRGSLLRISRRIDRQVSAGGLTSTETAVLGTIATRGPLGLGELAGYEGVNRTMLSRVIGKLEAAELIRRQSSITDRRAIQVVVTRKGARLRERLIAARDQLLTERLDELPPETVAALFEAIPALESLAEVLEPRPKLPQ
jgi:DNA-binding MarR family transcriptional regulator